MTDDIGIDEDLLDEALRRGGLQDPAQTVNQALLEFVSRRRRDALLAAFGTFDFDPGFDHKSDRDSR